MLEEITEQDNEKYSETICLALEKVNRATEFKSEIEHDSSQITILIAALKHKLDDEKKRGGILFPSCVIPDLNVEMTDLLSRLDNNVKLL